MNLSSVWMLLQHNLASDLTNMDTLTVTAHDKKKLCGHCTILLEMTPVQVHTLFLHARQYLDISDIVKFVGS